MSEPKWTPGPWIKTDRTEYRITLSAPRWAIEQESGSEPFWVALAINEANANILAAAPDLYAALSAIKDQLERIGDSRKDAPFIEEARAALAKARGEDDVEAV